MITVMETQKLLGESRLTCSNSDRVKMMLENIGASRSKGAQLSLQPAQPVEQISWWRDSIFDYVFSHPFLKFTLFKMGFTCVMAVRYVCNKHDFLCAGISFNQILEHARVASCLMNSGYKKYALLSVKGAWSGDLRGATELQAELIELLR